MNSTQYMQATLQKKAKCKPPGTTILFYTKNTWKKAKKEPKSSENRWILTPEKYFPEIIVFKLFSRSKKRCKNALFKGTFEISVLFKLAVFFVVLNCICLGFMQFHATFYFNYIIYSDLLIFRCQNVATILALLLFTRRFIYFFLQFHQSIKTLHSFLRILKQFIHKNF